MKLVSTSQFKPFTYDEMVKPLVQYKEAYDKLEQEYTNLAQQTELWKNVADQTNSPEAYKTYRRYANDLANITADFSRGMNLGNRRALLGMKGRYAQEIAPIATAAARRDALAAEQRKADLADPTMLWERRASDMSIDELIANPSMDYGKMFSGKQLTAQVYTAASALAKGAQDNTKEGDNVRRSLKQLLPFTYEYVRSNGFRTEDVLKAMTNSPDANRALTYLVDSAVGSTGIGKLDSEGNKIEGSGWGDVNTIKQAYNYAREGLYGAIGEAKSQIVKDEYGMAIAKANYEHRLAQQQQNQGLSPLDGTIPINTLRLDTPNAVNIRKRLNYDREVLGLSKDLGSGKFATYLDTKLTKFISTMGGMFEVPVQTSDGNKVRLIDTSTGRYLTREQFVKQGRDESDEVALNHYYTNMERAAKAAGITKLGGTSVLKVDKSITEFGKSQQGNLYMNAIDLPMKDKEAVFGKIKGFTDKGKGISSIKEVEGFNNDGTLKLSTRNVNIEKEFYNNKNGTLSLKDKDYSIMAVANGNIIIKYKGKMYAFSNSQLGSIVNGASYDVEKVKSLLETRQEYIDTYGEDAYLRSPEGRQIEGAIDQYGAAYVRQLSLALGLEYTGTSVPILSSSENKNP